MQNAYTLTFGGLLLLGARAGDILGRRRVFVAGIAMFTVASLLGGLAPSAAGCSPPAPLQGVGAAIAAPATLALLMTTFREGAERTRALALYSAVASGGGSIGLVLGGMLTDVGLVALGPVHQRPDRHRPDRARRRATCPRPRGARATSTSSAPSPRRVGMTALVYGFVRAASTAGATPCTVASFAAGALLLAAFVLDRAARRAADHAAPPVREPRALGRLRSPASCSSAACSACSSSSRSTCRACSASAPCRRAWRSCRCRSRCSPSARSCRGYAERVGDGVLLTGGVVTGARRHGLAEPAVGRARAYFPGVAMPMLLLGIGIGAAFTPLTAAGPGGRRPARRRRGLGPRQRRAPARRLARASASS